jgi:hypothetical protein
MGVKRIEVELNRDEVEALLDELEAEAARYKKKLELDARLLGRLHTFYGHNRPSGLAPLVTSAFRRTQNILRGI